MGNIKRELIFSLIVILTILMVKFLSSHTFLSIIYYIQGFPKKVFFTQYLCLVKGTFFGEVLYLCIEHT